jgi:hypothetical protein
MKILHFFNVFHIKNLHKKMLQLVKSLLFLHEMFYELLLIKKIQI